MQFELSALKQRRFKKAVILSVVLNAIDAKGETERGQACFIAHFVEQTKESVKVLQDRVKAIQADIAQKRKALEAAEILAKQDPSKEDEKDALAQALSDAEQAALDEMKTIKVEQIAQQWVGIEKHPLHEFPFVENGQELASTSENIRKLIELDALADVVSKAYLEEINPGLAKLLEGNLKK